MNLINRTMTHNGRTFIGREVFDDGLIMVRFTLAGSTLVFESAWYEFADAPLAWAEAEAKVSAAEIVDVEQMAMF